MDTSPELFGVPVGIIMDAVHGGIPVFEHEKAVLRDPLVQRLRHVSQTSLLSTVFPTATHTRFGHSLGAMHVAGRLIKSIVRAYFRDRHIDRIDSDSAQAVRYLFYSFRLAALLHDTGHAPFSHQFERSPSVDKILKNPSTFSALWAGVTTSYYQAPPTKLTHEDYSVRCAHEILNRINLPIEARDVIAIMDKTSIQPTERFCASAEKVVKALLGSRGASGKHWPHVLTWLRTMLSGELDVDRMDYMLRDSYFSGCEYGIYNLDHLLSTLRIGYDNKGWVGLAIHEKGLGALEDFVYSRFQLYSQLYSHKTAVGFSRLLDEAILEAAKGKDVKRMLTDISAFVHFTESFLWEQFHRIARESDRSASARLIRRDGLEFICSERDLVEKERQDLLRRLEEEHGPTTWKESDSKFSKICPAFDSILVLVRPGRGKTRRRYLASIGRRSAFFDKFRDGTITHFYKDPFVREGTTPEPVTSGASGG